MQYLYLGFTTHTPVPFLLRFYLMTNRKYPFVTETVTHLPMHCDKFLIFGFEFLLFTIPEFVKNFKSFDYGDFKRINTCNTTIPPIGFFFLSENFFWTLSSLQVIEDQLYHYHKLKKNISYHIFGFNSLDTEK